MSRKISGPARPRVKQPLPEDFICIAPAESLMLFDYLKRRRKDIDKRLVAVHLHLCYQCQETAKDMKDIDEALLKELKELLVVEEV